ncbi:unnamed protein product [Porites lobata]|uniref:G-protein coupled receptors family 1 profile domain-containing protein n=1 Tax=Porites lobata TaxID=104759 RepID=A0ABN8NGL3_9CNID|nr:unnamed protein product [Porites lobata]
MNIITIQALRKTSSLPKTLKTLLLSLAVSDLGVGLLVQPLYKKTFVLASHFGVFALTVDRFLAIHLHLRYQELVTHKRVVAVVISVWVLSASISILSGWQDFFIGGAVIVVVCLITTGLLYCKIYAAVRHHTTQIHTQVQQVQQATQNEDMANAARLKKCSLATFHIYLVYLACYLPIACVVLAKINGKTALYFTLVTLVYLNSSLNPLIYCWKMRHIRQTRYFIIMKVPLQFLFQGREGGKVCSCHLETFNRKEKHSTCTLHTRLSLFFWSTIFHRRKNSGTLRTLGDCSVSLENFSPIQKKKRHLQNSSKVLYKNRSLRLKVLKQKLKVLGLYPTLVANCIVNAFLSYTATVLNIITIQALRKTSSLARPLKTLLLSLTVSDLGVGLLVQPLYIALLVAFITEPNTSNSTHVTSLFIVFVAIANLLGCASFFGVAALAVDRYLAIHLHLRYQELVTHKRVVIAVILIWVFSAATIFLFSISINVRFIFSTTTGALIFATGGLLYCKIYAAVRHHTNQINAL